MISPTIKWVTQKHRYGPESEIAKIGLIVVGEAGWNGSRSQGDGPENQYSYRCYLPGLKEEFLRGVAATEEAAKTALERKIAHWFALLDKEVAAK